MQNVKRKLLLLLPLIALVLVVSLKAQAPNPGLSVFPASLDLLVDKGTTKTGEINLRNNTGQNVTIKVTARNFTAQGEEGQVEITDEDTPFSLSKWITVTPEQAPVRQGETVKFKYSINPPSNAEAGGHFGSLVFSTVPGELNQTGAVLSQEIASLFLVRIPGEVVEEAEIESFEAEKKFYEFGPVNFNLRVKNEGGVHIRPAGVVTVTDLFGNKSSFGFEGRNVLPGTVRKMPVIWDSTWLIGKYTANLALTFGSKNDQLYASADFYAFPLRVGIVALVVLVVLFLLRKRLIRAFKIILKGN